MGPTNDEEFVRADSPDLSEEALMLGGKDGELLRRTDDDPSFVLAVDARPDKPMQPDDFEDEAGDDGALSGTDTERQLESDHENHTSSQHYDVSSILESERHLNSNQSEVADVHEDVLSHYRMIKNSFQHGFRDRTLPRDDVPPEAAESETGDFPRKSVDAAFLGDSAHGLAISVPTESQAGSAQPNDTGKRCPPVVIDSPMIFPILDGPMSSPRADRALSTSTYLHINDSTASPTLRPIAAEDVDMEIDEDDAISYSHPTHTFALANQIIDESPPGTIETPIPEISSSTTLDSAPLSPVRSPRKPGHGGVDKPSPFAFLKGTHPVVSQSENEETASASRQEQSKNGKGKRVTNDPGENAGSSRLPTKETDATYQSSPNISKENRATSNSAATDVTSARKTGSSNAISSDTYPILLTSSVKKAKGRRLSTENSEVSKRAKIINQQAHENEPTRDDLNKAISRSEDGQSMTSPVGVSNTASLKPSSHSLVSDTIGNHMKSSSTSSLVSEKSSTTSYDAGFASAGIPWQRPTDPRRRKAIAIESPEMINNDQESRAAVQAFVQQQIEQRFAETTKKATTAATEEQSQESPEITLMEPEGIYSPSTISADFHRQNLRRKTNLNAITEPQQNLDSIVLFRLQRDFITPFQLAHKQFSFTHTFVLKPEVFPQLVPRNELRPQAYLAQIIAWRSKSPVDGRIPSITEERQCEWPSRTEIQLNGHTIEVPQVVRRAVESDSGGRRLVRLSGRSKPVYLNDYLSWTIMRDRPSLAPGTNTLRIVLTPEKTKCACKGKL